MYFLPSALNDLAMAIPIKRDCKELFSMNCEKTNTVEYWLALVNTVLPRPKLPPVLLSVVGLPTLKKNPAKFDSLLSIDASTGPFKPAVPRSATKMTSSSGCLRIPAISSGSCFVFAVSRN